MTLNNDPTLQPGSVADIKTIWLERHDWLQILGIGITWTSQYWLFFYIVVFLFSLRSLVYNWNWLYQVFITANKYTHRFTDLLLTTSRNLMYRLREKHFSKDCYSLSQRIYNLLLVSVSGVPQIFIKTRFKNSIFGKMKLQQNLEKREKRKFLRKDNFIIYHQFNT